MKLLFDNGTPAQWRRHLGGHIIHTAARLGWANLTNGDLLDSAEEAGYEVLITTDQSMRYQQNLPGRQMGIVVFLNPLEVPKLRRSRRRSIRHGLPGNRSRSTHKPARPKCLRTS